MPSYLLQMLDVGLASLSLKAFFELGNRGLLGMFADTAGLRQLIIFRETQRILLCDFAESNEDLPFQILKTCSGSSRFSPRRSQQWSALSAATSTRSLMSIVPSPFTSTAGLKPGLPTLWPFA